jgi:NAD(P)H-flavin reductase
MSILNAVNHTQLHSDPMLPNRFRIRRFRRELADTFTLELQPLDSHQVMPFSPGQFNMLYLFGVGEVPISISGDPGHPEILVHTIRAVGTVTKAMQQLRKGDVIGVRGPFGTAWPVKEARGYDVVIVAGGIGLAPLRPVIYDILAHREQYGNVAVLYGTRSPETMLFRNELEKWRGRFDMKVRATVDFADATWRSNIGVVTKLISRTTFDPLNAVAMICGPEIMMRFTAMELLGQGLETKHIFISMERNMQCAIGYCGHCQYGPAFICKDGPVFQYSQLERWLSLTEI